LQDTKAKQTDELTPEPEEAGALPLKQELALRAILSLPTLKEAALSAGISETTLWRFMQDEAFSRRLREARRDAVNHAVIRLQRASSDAVTVLHDLMKKDDAPASARITAARTILDYSIRAVEMDELRTRIEELEEFIKVKQEENALDKALEEAKNKG
jgi:uncharacterized protein YydD (DUF2326 family)